jgi:hypothetical protein
MMPTTRAGLGDRYLGQRRLAAPGIGLAASVRVGLQAPEPGDGMTAPFLVSARTGSNALATGRIAGKGAVAGGGARSGRRVSLSPTSGRAA